MVSIDDSAAKAMKGVIAVTHIPGMPDYLIPEAVAVTAETFGIAKKAKNALKIKWSAGPMDQLSDAQIDDMLNGIIDQVTSPGEGVEATFRWPYVPARPDGGERLLRHVHRRTSPRAGAAPRCRATLQRQMAETLGMPGRERHVPRDPGRWCLRPSPVPRPGRPGRADLPAGRQADQAAVDA